jgi:hypothetical protein
MISLKFNSGELDKFYHQINLKVEGLSAPLDPQVLTEINNAIFTVSSRRFVRAMNLAAKSNPKKYHHIYEWGYVGDNKKRLFYLRKDLSSGKYLRVGAGFLKSKTPVPIPAELLQPGKTGRSVVSRSVFANKAEVMESGTAIRYEAQKTLAFLQKNGAVGFIPKGKIINILNPGGSEVKGAFETFFQDWYKVNTAIVIQTSGILESLQIAMTNALNEYNAGIGKAKEESIRAMRSYQGGAIE